MENQVVTKEKRRYTKGEEIFNAVTHIVGGVIGIAILIIGIIFAVIYKDAFAVAGMAVYGSCMILTYTMSAIYHFLRPNKAKRLFRVLDHCTIFMLIAGTYTPICLVSLRNSGGWGWSLFGAIWLLAAIGITFNAVNMHNRIIKILSYIAYILMGWCAVFAIVPILQVLPFAGFMWIIGGGIAYTVGMLFYAVGKKKKYIHSVWHLFVLAGSILQFFGILFYVIIY